MNTPFFPAFRSRLAALGRRTTHALRQATLSQLQQHLVDLLPPPLLSAMKVRDLPSDDLLSLGGLSASARFLF